MSKVFQAMDKARRKREFRTSGTYQAHSAQPIPFPPGEVPEMGRSHEASSSLGDDLDPPAPAGRIVIKEGQFGVPDPHLVSLVAPDSVESEQYRSLRHTVEQLNQEEGRAQVVAVTSATHGDGKTLTTLNLAGALAQKKQASVLVVDADLRRPAIAGYLGMKSVPRGLSELVSEREAQLEDAIRRHRRYNLSVLASRSAITSPYEILKSARLDALMQEVRFNFDYILLDTPPLTLPDCRLLEKNVDGFLLVVAAHRTPRELVESALEALAPEKLLGLVFNYDHRRLAGYYKGGRATGNRTFRE